MIQPQHDHFAPQDLPDDGQRLLLARWLEIARSSPQVPSAVLDRDWIGQTISGRYVMVDLTPGPLRLARVLAAGKAVRHELGFDPVGMTADKTVPGPYLADMIPAYALCAYSFQPTAAVDDLIRDDGSRTRTWRLILPFDRQPPGAAQSAGTLLMTYLHAPDDDHLIYVGRLEQIVAVVSQGLRLFGNAPAAG